MTDAEKGEEATQSVRLDQPSGVFAYDSSPEKPSRRTLASARHADEEDQGDVTGVAVGDTSGLANYTQDASKIMLNNNSLIYDLSAQETGLYQPNYDSVDEDEMNNWEVRQKAFMSSDSSEDDKIGGNNENLYKKDAANGLLSYERLVAHLNKKHPRIDVTTGGRTAGVKHETVPRPICGTKTGRVSCIKEKRES